MNKRHLMFAGILIALMISLAGCDVSRELLNYLEEAATQEASEATEGSEMQPSAERETELEEVRLIRVVDGDTLLVDLKGEETYVRLIGINTPESVAPEEYLEKTGKENTEEGSKASNFVRELLSQNSSVWLEYDEERLDQYGRTLAYVWTSADVTEISNMLNARLVMEGLAETMTIRPNVRHAEELAALADDGR